MCITGVCGAGKSTLGRAWSHQAQLPVHRRDDDLDCRQLVEPELPDVSRWTGSPALCSVSFSEVAFNHVSRRLQQAGPIAPPHGHMRLERGRNGGDALLKLGKRQARAIQKLRGAGLQSSEPSPSHGTCLLALSRDVRGASDHKAS